MISSGFGLVHMMNMTVFFRDSDKKYGTKRFHIFKAMHRRGLCNTGVDRFGHILIRR